MWDKLSALEKRFEEMEALLADPQVAQDPQKLRELGQERASLEEPVALFRQYRKLTQTLEDTRSLLGESSDPEMAQLAQQEVESLEGQRQRLEAALKLSLVPRDPRDERDVIIEIRAGAGGEEASLFAADLFRMYSRYAASRRWDAEVLNANLTGLGGFKEIIFEVRGKGAFRRLKYEAGVHRVQRVPATEASGRLHTSTATVAVLPQAEEVEVRLNPDELRVEFFRSSGPGGQNVNKVSSAVRLIHLPTGMVVECQEERSQFRNRLKAEAVLRARLLEQERQKQQSQLSQERRSQVGTAERAEKIRTYNYPQSRVTDHRIDLTLYNLPQVMEGEIEPLIEALAGWEAENQLKAVLT